MTDGTTDRDRCLLVALQVVGFVGAAEAEAGAVGYSPPQPLADFLAAGESAVCVVQCPGDR